MLVLGGTGSRHEKLSDVWRLDLADQKKKHSAHLVLTLDAITHEAAAEATAAAEAATGDAAEEGSPLSSPRKREVLQHEKLVASLSGACGGLPAECFRVSSVDSAEPPALAAFAAAAAAEAGDDALAGRVTVRVDVLPLVGVGFNTLDGKDGEELPVAAIAALEAKLRRACPMPEDGAAVVPDAKGGKDAKGKPAAKKGAKDANDGAAEEEAAKAAAARAAAHKRVVGYGLLGWRVHRATTVTDVPTVKWVGAPVVPAPKTDATAALAAASGCEDTGGMSPRAGHSATRLRDCIVVFGGGGINGTLNDTWTISAPPLAPPLAYSDDDRGVDDGVDNRGEGGAELQWVLPEVSGTPPSPRAYHSACGRLNYAEDGLEQLLVFGGTGAAGRLNDLHILHFPSMHWTSPRCDESGAPPPTPRCWHTCAAICPAASTAFGMVVFGGVDGNGRERRDAFLLRPLTSVEPPEGAAPVDPKGGKGGKAPPPAKGGKGAPPPAEGEEEEDTRPLDFIWEQLPEAPFAPRPRPDTTFSPAAAPPAGGAGTFALTAVPAMTASAPPSSFPAPAAGSGTAVATRDSIQRPSSAGAAASSAFAPAAAAAARPSLSTSASASSFRRGGGGGSGGGVPGGARAVGLGDEEVIVFGSLELLPTGADDAAAAMATSAVPGTAAAAGSCLPLQRWLKTFLLVHPLDREKVDPPKLTLSGVKLTRLPMGVIRSAVAAGGCSLVLSTAEDDTVLVRTRMTVHSSLMPGGSNGPGGEPMLSCDQCIAEKGYDGRSHLHLSLVVGGRLVGRCPLGTLLRTESKGTVQRASLVDPKVADDPKSGAPPVALVQFDWKRVGGPPDPPALPLLGPDGRPSGEAAPTTARAALDRSVQAGLGDASDEYKGQFVDGLPHGVGTCHYASGAVYNGQWQGGLRHGQGELKDEHGHVYRGGFANGEQAGLGAWHYADGATYTGPMLGGLRHGRGVYRAADGAVYDGEWRHGQRNGQGIDTSADQLKTYSGGWKDDLKHGKGRLVLRESLKSQRTTTYDGEWRHDVKWGFGRLVWPLGDSYTGEWQNDLRNGRGLLRLVSGEEYDGKWVGDVRCGEGTCKLPGGELYTGQWSAGGRWGDGTCVYTDGSRYIGQWRGGQRHGKGKLSSLDGLEEHDGTWSLDQPHGKGTHHGANGDVYTGFFHAGERSGHGVLKTPHGDSYDGEWARGLQEGHGTFVSSDGETYVGQWVAGERCGRGRCEQPNGDVYDGEWQHSMRMGHGDMTYAVSVDPEIERRANAARARGAAARRARAAKKVDPSQLPRYSGGWMYDEREGLGRMSFPPKASAPLVRPATATAARGSAGPAVVPPRSRPGSAVATVSGGEWYEGEWLRGRRHGRGAALFPNGECYVGDWIEGMRNGVGTLASRPGEKPVQSQQLHSPGRPKLAERKEQRRP